MLPQKLLHPYHIVPSSELIAAAAELPYQPVAHMGVKFHAVPVEVQVLLPFREPLVAFFSPTPAVIHAGAVYLQCIMPFYFMFAVMFCLNNAMRGAGDSVFPMVDVILSLILVRVPAVYYLAERYGPDYMYYGCAVGWAVGLALSLGWYFSGRWKRHGSLADEGGEGL